MRLIFGVALALWLSVAGFAFTQQNPAATAPPERFDFVVRADFFAGFQGDTARFDRAMARCDEELAKNPDHA